MTMQAPPQITMRRIETQRTSARTPGAAAPQPTSTPSSPPDAPVCATTAPTAPARLDLAAAVAASPDVAPVAAALESLTAAAAGAAALDSSVRRVLLPALERKCGALRKRVFEEMENPAAGASAEDAQAIADLALASRAVTAVREMQPALAVGAAIAAVVRDASRWGGAACVVCCGDVAGAADAVMCEGDGGGRHPHCLRCVSKVLASLSTGAKLGALAKAGGALACLRDGCGRRLEMLSLASPLLATPPRAAALARYLEAREAAATLTARKAWLAERRRLEGAPLEERIVRVLEGVRCPECDALYDASTDACMHAHCTMCAATFCGFCFETGCRAERCALNATGLIQRDAGEKPALLLLLQATRIAALVRGVPPDARAAALRRAAPRLAAHDARLVVDSATLLVPSMHDCITPSLLFNLRAAYGGGPRGDAAPKFALADLTPSALCTLQRQPWEPEGPPNLYRVWKAPTPGGVIKLVPAAAAFAKRNAVECCLLLVTHVYSQAELRGAVERALRPLAELGARLVAGGFVKLVGSVEALREVCEAPVVAPPGVEHTDDFDPEPVAFDFRMAPLAGAVVPISSVARSGAVLHVFAPDSPQVGWWVPTAAAAAAAPFDAVAAALPPPGEVVCGGAWVELDSDSDEE